MLPISNKDRIDIRPYDYAVRLSQRAADKLVAEAQKALDEAADKAAKKAAESALAAAKTRAEQMVKDAQEEAAKHPDQKTYVLKVPTTRSRAAVTRDVNAEGVPGHTNLAIVNALSAAADAEELEPEAAVRVRDAKAVFDLDGTLESADWDAVWDIAKTHPVTAKMIADRAYRWEIERFHLLRHHVLLEGHRTPLPEIVADSIPEAERMLLSTKIIEMLTPSEEEVKN